MRATSPAKLKLKAIWGPRHFAEGFSFIRKGSSIDRCFWLKAPNVFVKHSSAICIDKRISKCYNRCIFYFSTAFERKIVAVLRTYRELSFGARQWSRARWIHFVSCRLKVLLRVGCAGCDRYIAEGVLAPDKAHIVRYGWNSVVSR